MSKPETSRNLVDLDVSQPIWDRFFWVAPLVLIGTVEADGSHDLAPKHMAFPLGWDNYFGFVCTPRHHTYTNASREGCFTVSYPGPDQLVLTSLAASPRYDQDEKPALAALPVIPAHCVAGVLVENCPVYLECELDRMVDGFGVNSLVVGRVVAARVDARALRMDDAEDPDIIRGSPLLAYLNPGRFTAIADSRSFPFPAGMKK